MTRRFAVLISLAAVLAIPSLAHAGTVTLNDYSGSNAHFINNTPGGGGAFTATTGGGGPLGAASFITFCLEFIEHFSYGGEYNYALTNGAVNGGVAGGNPDTLSDATKWIYYQVVTGNYSTIAAFGSGDVGIRVQEAIWLIEQERDVNQVSDPTSATLKAYAESQSWSAISALGYEVHAMNLTSVVGNFPQQDQLALTTPTSTTQNFNAPEPASLFLLGTGLLFTSRRLIRRKTRS